MQVRVLPRALAMQMHYYPVTLGLPTGESVRTQLSAWAEPALAILGLVTLVGALLSWRENRRTVNLQVARRARRVQRVLDEWLRHSSLIAASSASPNQSGQLKVWVDYVTKGEDEVQDLLEQMLDKAGGASRAVQRAARPAYGQFLRGVDLINKYGQPHLTGHTTPADPANDARQYFESALREVAKIVPRDLL